MCHLVPLQHEIKLCTELIRNFNFSKKNNLDQIDT
jgi:hypothetical protein